VDQIVSSHPLFSPAETVEDMEQYFDSISYEKVLID
jgi:aminopeptidase N